MLDSGKWDSYYALFARDASVPWKKISVRLDTYSGAAVDFAAYSVDPTDVLVAGANARPRAIDTSHMRPAARWRFSPPPGLKFESNDVDVPLMNREGFYVIEARRGDAVQQVWVNVSRAGLLTKESPAGSIIYGTDLGTGRALARMRITYLVNRHFVYDQTDAHGISHVPAHAVFALAEWGASKAFAGLLPQSPPPNAVIGVRADRASVTAGENVRVVGFARRRNGNVYRPATGEVTLTMVADGKTLATSHAALDKSGAFTTSFALPVSAPAGDAVILATANGASGGATIHVNSVGGITLIIGSTCAAFCPPAAAIPLTVTARRSGVPAASQSLHVRIVRSPHVQVPDANDDAAVWGVTTIVDTTLTTDALGVAHVAIPAPSDGLPSTYGVTAESGSSTATANLVAPDARVALSIVPERDNIDVSDSAAFDVRGFDALDGAPASGLPVHVRITHGPTTQDQQVALSGDGTARVTFSNVALGMNLASAEATIDGKRTVDISAVTVAPLALAATTATSSSDVKISLDRQRQHPNDRVNVSATLAGATGDALVTLESMRGVSTVVVPAQNGTANAAVTIPETIGALAVGVAFVRDGAIVNATLPLVIDGPGHQRLIALTPDHSAYLPGATARITIGDGDDRSPATLAVRLSDRRAAGGASFDDVPGVLSSSGTTTQNLASTDPPWHTWVAPARSKAGDIFGFDRPRQTAANDTQIVAATTRVLSWNVDRLDGGTFDVTLPREPGRYVLGIVKITDDGDVGAASIALTVQ